MPRPPNFFPYFGGKYYHAHRLIDLFPSHHCYVDVFGGAGNVLIQKPLSKVEVFNDINSDIVNLFRVLREDFDTFYEFTLLTPYSREVFSEYRDQIKTETDSVRRACLWFSLACQSVGGLRVSWKASKKWGNSLTQLNKVNRLPEIVNRLHHVQLENHDFFCILEKYDGKDTFFYLDPPYVPETRSPGIYQDEMSFEDHEKLVDVLKGIKGKAMLSGYPNDLYDTLGWQKQSFATMCKTVSAKTSATKRTEVVWMNYEVAE